MQLFASSLPPADQLQVCTAEAASRVREMEEKLSGVRARIVKGEADLRSLEAKGKDLRAERAKALADGRSDSAVAKITTRIKETVDAESVVSDLLMGLTAAEAEATLALESATILFKETSAVQLRQNFLSAVDRYNAAAVEFAGIVRGLYVAGDVYGNAEFQARPPEGRHYQRPQHPVHSFIQGLGSFPIRSVLLLGQTPDGQPNSQVLFNETETREGLSW